MIASKQNNRCYVLLYTPSPRDILILGRQTAKHDDGRIDRKSVNRSSARVAADWCVSIQRVWLARLPALALATPRPVTVSRAAALEWNGPRPTGTNRSIRTYTLRTREYARAHNPPQQRTLVNISWLMPVLRFLSSAFSVGGIDSCSYENVFCQYMMNRFTHTFKFQASFILACVITHVYKLLHAIAIRQGYRHIYIYISLYSISSLALTSDEIAGYTWRSERAKSGGSVARA